MKLLLITCTCIMVLLLAACGICSKKVPCPAFDDDMLESWFPYDDGSIKLRFTNSSQVQEFNLITNSTPSYTATQTQGKGCNATRTISSNETIPGGHPAMYLQLEKYQPFFSNADERTVILSLLGLQIEGIYLDEKGFSQVFNKSQGGTGMLKYHNSITLGGKLFGQVQQISFDTGLVKKPPVYNIYISQRNGIVAYQTYSPALLWVKE